MHGIGKFRQVALTENRSEGQAIHGHLVEYDARPEKKNHYKTLRVLVVIDGWARDARKSQTPIPKRQKTGQSGFSN
jgi:hypothetical protein